MKRFTYTIAILIVAICMQSCGAQLDGTWKCTDAQADGKNIDELSQITKDALQNFVGITIKIDGNEFFRKQNTPDMVIYTKGNIELSPDAKTLTTIDRQITQGGTKWHNLPKDLMLPIQREVLIFTDKELKLRTKGKNLFGENFVFTYTKQ
ncbi:MAG: hypothetical protein K6F33_02940 [Bacteroidales bacterium]|nr:hypothetical protein [Bacteroidales bacterium]